MAKFEMALAKCGQAKPRHKPFPIQDNAAILSISEIICASEDIWDMFVIKT